MWPWILRGLQTGARVSGRWIARLWSAPARAAGAVGTRVGGIIGAYRGAGSAASFVIRQWETRTAFFFSEAMKIIQVSGATVFGFVGAEELWNRTGGAAFGYLSKQGRTLGTYVIFLGAVYFAAQYFSRRK